MKFLIGYASNGWIEKPCAAATPTQVIWSPNVTGDAWGVEINTLDELIALTAEVGYPVVIFPPAGRQRSDDDPRYQITIYDSYIE